MNENSIWKNYLKLVQIGLTLILLSAVSIPLFLILPALLFFTTGIWIHAIYYTLMEALIISFFITGFTCIIIRVFGVILFKKISRSPSSSEYSYIYRLIFLGILAILL